MEAKVDVRKLQILNDRINQTIDALNQVRLSVHGLGHTGGLQSQINPLAYLTQGMGMQQPYGIGTPGSFPGVGGPFGGMQQGGMQGLTPNIPFGLQHSPFQQLQQGGLQGLTPNIPFGLQGLTPNIPFGQQGLTPNIPFGLQHSPFQQLQQVNPFLNPYSQVGSPWGQTGSPWSLYGQTGGIGGGLGGIGGGVGGFGGGLSQMYGGGAGLFHSPFQGTDLIERQLVEARANDPFRITQTFPFVVS